MFDISKYIVVEQESISKAIDALKHPYKYDKDELSEIISDIEGEEFIDFAESIGNE